MAQLEQHETGYGGPPHGRTVQLGGGGPQRRSTGSLRLTTRMPAAAITARAWLFRERTTLSVDARHMNGVVVTKSTARPTCSARSRAAMAPSCYA